MSRASKKILFVSFFSSPMAAIGATRIGKLIKYFNKNGWEIHLLTAASCSFRFQDKSSGEDIRDTNVIRINPVITLDRKRKATTINEGKTASIGKHKLFIPAKVKSFISGYIQYFFNAGSKSLFLIKDWEQSALTLIAEQDIKYVFVTFSPILPLKIGIWLKRKLGNKIFLIADFRDLIVDNPYSPSNIFLRIINKNILKEADLVTTVSKGTAYKLNNQIRECCMGREKEVLVLSNGFDPEDEKFVKTTLSVEDKITKFVYAGSLYLRLRDPTNLFIALEQLKNSGRISDKNFKFIYCGKDYGYVDFLSNKFGINDLVVNKGLLLRKEALRLQREANMLVLFSRDGKNEEGVLTGKIYEYIASGRPILLLGDGCTELKDMVSTIPGSKCIKNGDINAIRDFVLSMVIGQKQRKVANVSKTYSIENSPYSYSYIVKEFIEHLTKQHN